MESDDADDRMLVDWSRHTDSQVGSLWIIQLSWAGRDMVE